MTKVIKPRCFKRIVDSLKKGEVVAFATDTVFGIGVCYDNLEALNKMKVAKGRDEKKPFPLMVCDISQMQMVAFLKDREKKLVEKFAPGALTLVLKKKEVIKDEFTSGLDSIAIRIPDDEFLLRLLKEVGPMFVTSANISGEPATNSHEEVLKQLNGKIDLVVEGKAKSGISSTIVDCTKEELVLLREGDITKEDINNALAC
ncbi:MAG: L-threonylcarbamoyladenylate synthase [Erysipelotrichaceae bacterium]|jgi:L-threonylcarbamoyladenylate synthase